MNVVIHEGRRPLSYFRNCIPHLKYWTESIQQNKGFGETKQNHSNCRRYYPEYGVLGENFFIGLDPLAVGKRGLKKPVELKKNDSRRPCCLWSTR